MHLDMQKLFTAGFGVILRSQCFGLTMSPSLATAMLSRLALDTALLRNALVPRPDDDQEEVGSVVAARRRKSIAGHIFLVFCGGVYMPADSSQSQGELLRSPCMLYCTAQPPSRHVQRLHSAARWRQMHAVIV